MSNKKFKIIYHFELLKDIVLFGKIDYEYFICVITKFSSKLKKTKEYQSTSCIYIQDDDKYFYCIQISIFSDKDRLNNTLKEWFLEMIKKNAENIFKNLINNSSEMKIKLKNNKFFYESYDIPGYIWCIFVGMLTAEL
jgi:hypothetical protein